MTDVSTFTAEQIGSLERAVCPACAQPADAIGTTEQPPPLANGGRLCQLGTYREGSTRIEVYAWDAHFTIPEAATPAGCRCTELPGGAYPRHGSPA